MDELISMLVNGVATVTFTKVSDGTSRTMPCTMNESLIPANMLSRDSNRTKNENIVTVYALDKNEWRSFRRDSVTSYFDGITGVELNQVN